MRLGYIIVSPMLVYIFIKSVDIVLYHGHPHKYPAQFFKDVYEEFEDAKGVIRIRKSKDRQQINNQTL
jgi:hypothetical protein